MAKPAMGTKRQCQACGTKFFDMEREKPTCPKCGTVFQAVAVSRAPARAAAAAAAAPVDDEEKSADTEGADIVSLDDADADAQGDAPVTGDDDVEDEDDAGDTFLEDEEEDGDDVTGLIDGDIETDEEP